MDGLFTHRGEDESVCPRFPGPDLRNRPEGDQGKDHDTGCRESAIGGSRVRDWYALEEGRARLGGTGTVTTPHDGDCPSRPSVCDLTPDSPLIPNVVQLAHGCPSW